MTAPTKTITQITRKYIYDRPSIHDCIARGLINHSALARLICKEKRIRKFDAVHAACKRFEYRSTLTHIRKVEKLIKGGEIYIDSNVSMMIMKPMKNIDRLYKLQQEVRDQKGKCHIVDSTMSIRVIVHEKFAKLFTKKFHAYQKLAFPKLAEITLNLDDECIKVPGIMAHFYGLLSYNDINVVGEMSYVAGMRVLVARTDVPKAIEIFSGTSLE